MRNITHFSAVSHHYNKHLSVDEHKFFKDARHTLLVCGDTAYNFVAQTSKKTLDNWQDI